MSPGLSERSFEWGRWVERELTGLPDGITVCGFVHHCGGANLVDAFADIADAACSSCRTEIKRPLSEVCFALFARSTPDA